MIVREPVQMANLPPGGLPAAAVLGAIGARDPEMAELLAMLVPSAQHDDVPVPEPEPEPTASASTIESQLRPLERIYDRRCENKAHHMCQDEGSADFPDVDPAV